ncbi:AAA family ATPase [Bacillus paramycoides]|uniref:ATP-binding protein n=1 Tax=Bacillus paramycoides TaxID=2026194 RepID=UPI0015B87872|nr:ATP-binding protein [Bacillus paramycoides]NWK71140.1 AAA family ATPase [Bacillus paramycoides]
MKIKSIHINNLLSINNEEFIFPEPHVNYFGDLKISIIVGENGTCKTSLLKFLAEAFLYPHIRSKNIRDYEKGFKINYEIHEKEAYIEENHPSFTDSTGLVPKENVALMPSNIIVSTTALNGKFANVSREINNIKYIYTGPLKSTRATIFRALMDKELEESVQRLLELMRYSKEYRIVMPNEEILLKRIRQNAHKLGFLNEDVLQNFLTVHTKISSQYKNSKRLRAIYHGQINTFWLETIEKIMEARINVDFQLEIFSLTHNEWINFTDMSSGEQAMFDRFFPLLKLVKNNSLVLIDEPETHLHPRWLKQYVFILSQLFSSFKAHIIVATHSPLIAADVPNDCIIGLVKCPETGNIKQYNINKSTLGGNQPSILNDVFRLDIQTGSFTNLIIGRIKECMENGEKENALDMFNDLGTTVNKYSLYNELMELFPEEFK